MELKLFEADNGDCPYLDSRKWCSHMFCTRDLSGSAYEYLLNCGFRRSGFVFYRNNCPACKLCVPIRIMVNTFTPTRSQKKTVRKNRETDVTLHKIGYDHESFALYQKYASERFGTETTQQEYRESLVQSAIDTRMVKYRHGSRLIGIGWIDVLPRSLSSVYFAFDPKYARRSLGVYSILWEIEMAKYWGKDFLHLGFWVRGCSSMEYKSRYKPHQLLINEEWIQC